MAFLSPFAVVLRGYVLLFNFWNALRFSIWKSSYGIRESRRRFDAIEDTDLIPLTVTRPFHIFWNFVIKVIGIVLIAIMLVVLCVLNIWRLYDPISFGLGHLPIS